MLVEIHAILYPSLAHISTVSTRDMGSTFINQKMSSNTTFLQPTTSRRLMKEIESCHKDKEANVKIELLGADMSSF
jgi:hypothetical protein